jgi:prophage antirepressor-like protein
MSAARAEIGRASVQRFNDKAMAAIEFMGRPCFLAFQQAEAMEADPRAFSNHIGSLVDSGEMSEGRHIYYIRDAGMVAALRAAFDRDLMDSMTTPIKDGTWQVTLVTIHGAIRAAMTSRAPRAKEFRDWAEDVLFNVLTTGRHEEPGAAPTLDLTTAAECRRVGDRLQRAGDRAAALACYQRAAAALGVETTPGVVPPEPRTRRAPPQGEQVPLLPVKAAASPTAPAPTVDEDWPRFVALWRERFGRQRTRASELIALVTSAGLFRKALANRDEHARVTVLGRIIAKHYGRGVERGKSGEPYVVLATP